jgi:CYTH domain-containing protein
MAIEIEHKFLAELPPGWETLPCKRLRQAYLVSEEHLTVRIRLEASQAWLTIKSATEGLSRYEYEYPVPLADAEEMLTTVCRGAVIEKTRYYLKQGHLTWEIDVFEGENAGLVVAEMEVPTPDEVFDRPAWVGEDVTDDPRYSNAWLSRHPFTTWGHKSL